MTDTLGKFYVSRSDITSGGGGKSQMTQDLESRLVEHGWVKRRFDVQLLVDGTARDSTTHEIDHVRAFEDGRRAVALEIEWNNKDPFYDRDLENFKRLHDLGVVSIGIIITRGPGLQSALQETYRDYYAHLGEETLEEDVARVRGRRRRRLAELAGEERRRYMGDIAFRSKYGTATTNWPKLQARINRDLGDPCPLVLIGIRAERLVGEFGEGPATDAVPD